MQDLNISFIQADLIWEEPAANKAQFESYFQSIENANLVVLPEMFSTGFTMNAKAVAEKMDGKTVTWMKAQAQKHQFSILGSIVIEEKGSYFNRMLYVDREGKVQYYDKMHLFSLAKEEQHYTSGVDTKIILLEGWKIMLQICYDLRFQSPFSNSVLQEEYKYDVLINVANWPAVRSAHWKALLLSRAIENQAYVVGVNRVGQDEKGFNYSGDSAVIDVEGISILKTQPNQSGVYSVCLSKEKLKEARRKLPFLKDKLI